MAATTHYRTCPFCEATCGLEVEVDGDKVLSVQGRQGRRLLARLHLPEGDRPEVAPGGPRPADPADAQAGRRRRTRRSSWDEAFALIDARLMPLLERARPRRVRRLPGQPERALAGRAAGRAACGSRALGSKNIYSASTVDQMPKQISAGLMFGTIAERPDPGRRPHRPLHDPGREPARLERVADDRARHARPAARDPRARRQGRRRRPAPHAHRRGRRRARTSSARAPTRTCCSAMVHTLFDEGLVVGAAAAGRAHRRAGRRRAARARRSRPRRWRRSCGVPADDDPPHGARAGGRRARPSSTAGSAPARRSSARSRPGWSTS